MLVTALDAAAVAGRLPKALIVVDLYGQCADLAPITAACQRHGVFVIEDAAEALGQVTVVGRPAVLVTCRFCRSTATRLSPRRVAACCWVGTSLGSITSRHLSTQAREPAAHYEHKEIGYNYRLSNLLAAVGRVQLGILTVELRVDAQLMLAIGPGGVAWLGLYARGKLWHVDFLAQLRNDRRRQFWRDPRSGYCGSCDG